MARNACCRSSCRACGVSGCGSRPNRTASEAGPSRSWTQESMGTEMPTKHTFASRRIAVNGITLNVVIEGEGPDVLLVHGFPDSHQVWRKQIPALVAAGYRVIAPDLRGFGDSDAPTEVSAYAVPRFVADLKGVLDALG